MTGPNKRTSCQSLFPSLNILTLPSHYIFHVIMFHKFKINFIQTGADLHDYNTRNKNHRQTLHRIDISASLPQNLGPKLFN
jgi:hypothetical protein